MVNTAVEGLTPEFEAMYSQTGRRSVAAGVDASVALVDP